jgi:5-methylcytosine-specific restriction endonuclease McrA
MEYTGHAFTVDHVIPTSRGGTDDFDNLCLCCFWCNNYKQAAIEATDSRTGRVVSLFNPRTDE